MSSLTSLGINKNKKKFGPTLNKNKNRSRKTADSSNQTTSSQVASDRKGIDEAALDQAEYKKTSSIETAFSKTASIDASLSKTNSTKVAISKETLSKTNTSETVYSKADSTEIVSSSANLNKTISENTVSGQTSYSQPKLDLETPQTILRQANSNTTDTIQTAVQASLSPKINTPTVSASSISNLATPLMHTLMVRAQSSDNESSSSDTDALTQEELALNQSFSNRRFTNQPKVIPAPDLSESKQPVETNSTNNVNSPEAYGSKTMASLEPSEYPHTPGVMAALSPEYPHTPSAMYTSPEYTATPHNNVASPEYTTTPHNNVASPEYAAASSPDYTTTPKATPSSLDASYDNSEASLNTTIAHNTNTHDVTLASRLPLSSNIPNEPMIDEDNPINSRTTSSSIRGESSHFDPPIDIEGADPDSLKESSPVEIEGLFPDSPKEDSLSNAQIDIGELDSVSPSTEGKRSKRKRRDATEDESSERKRGRTPHKGKEATVASSQLKEIQPKKTPKKPKEKSKEKPKEKAKEKSKEKSKEKPKESAKAVAIGIGVPSSSNTHTSPDTQEKNPNTKKQKEKPAKKNEHDFRLPENLRTLDDVPNPTGADHVDRPMNYFIRDIDGVVSKSFKELEMQRFEEIKQKAAIVHMSTEEQEEFQKKKSEELEKKKKLLEEKKAEEERRKKELANSVLQETSTAPQVRIINGQIVLDTDSLTVERSQSGQEFYDGAMEIVEESAMTRKVNSHTYGKKGSSVRWTSVETDMFYELLSQFGTDFETISKMIPGRTRSHIRLKFNKEEKLRPEKITDFLIHRRKKPDINMFKEMTNLDLEDVPADFNEMQLL